VLWREIGAELDDDVAGFQRQRQRFGGIGHPAILLNVRARPSRARSAMQTRVGVGFIAVRR
jgi:hypothetical protein